MRYYTFIILALLVCTYFNDSAQAQQKQAETEEKYKEELKKLQKEIEMLKLKILETRKALKNFEDMILLGTLTGTKITLYYKNELKSAEVQEVSVILDGFEVSRIKDKKKIDEASGKEIIIYDEAEAIPGKHVVDVVFTVKGEKIFKKAIRYDFDVEKNIATIIRVKTQRSPSSKVEKLPEDIDILISSEKSKIISK